MNLNDPFGRLESRHQLGYESMRKSMRTNGIDTSEAALEVFGKSKKRGLKYILIGMAILLLVTLILPSALPITLSLGVVLVVVTFSSINNGKRYIRRYIEEDLNLRENSDS
ncbi:MAG: hypothetical protein COA36_05190 [Desulfotalea sp.]|nr:MAG: hypothetical protein COA36_05190 [Desulfotalea sp.]